MDQLQTARDSHEELLSSYLVPYLRLSVMLFRCATRSAALRFRSSELFAAKPDFVRY